MQALAAHRTRTFLLMLLLIIAWKLNPRYTAWSTLWLRPLASLLFFALLVWDAQRHVAPREPIAFRAA